VRGSSVLTSLLVLPLYVPVLILGSGAVDAAAGGVAVQAHLLLLAAFLLAACVLAPWATAAALRIALD
jgi:heme exporter protein B